MPEEEIDAFLESGETVQELMEKEFSPTDPSETFIHDLEPVEIEDDEVEVEVSPDKSLIRGKGIALTNIDTEGVGLDEELEKEVEVAATYTDGDLFDDPALNSVFKSTMNRRAERVRAGMDKRELLDLAGDIVESYFRKHVKSDGIDEEELNRLKFAARKHVAETLRE